MGVKTSAVSCWLVQEEPDWATAKRVLGQPKFIERLMAYDADNIADSVLDSLQRVVTDPRFTADQVWPAAMYSHHTLTSSREYDPLL